MTEALYSMTDIRNANKAAGNHWFDRATMRFFDSHVGSAVYPAPQQARTYFVSSEQFRTSNGHSAARKYTVRFARWADEGVGRARGTIDTLGQFNLLTREAAHKLAKMAQQAPTVPEAEALVPEGATP